MAKKIYLDPGHGGSDPGAVNGTRHEADDNLRLALKVRDVLEAQGQTVMLTREDDSSVTLYDRTEAANAARADIFVSLHRNAYTDSTAKGVEIWVYTTAGVAETAAAAEVLEQLAAVGVQQVRGVKKGNYYVCRETDMYSMMIELGFITNQKDNELFDDKFDAYAKAIARGVCESLGEAWSEETQEQAGAGPLYRVQIGAFRSREYAEAFLEDVKVKGLDAFIVRIADSCEQ